MGDIRAASRYARAFLDLAEERKKIDEATRDFEHIEALLRSSRDFVLFLRSPIINKEKKKGILAELLKGKVGELTHRLVEMLCAKGREMLLPDIIKQFYELRDRRLGILHAVVRTAAPFRKEQEERLMHRLEQLTKKRVQLEFAVDPTLKGGFRVQIDDTVWDGTVAHQLQILRKRFAEGATA
jgi:F-type H+-transporting ATPase subunit delta